MGNGVIRDQHPQYDIIMVDSFPLGEGFYQSHMRHATRPQDGDGFEEANQFTLVPFIAMTWSNDSEIHVCH